MYDRIAHKELSGNEKLNKGDITQTTQSSHRTVYLKINRYAQLIKNI